jgi:23S rRNA-/tRNA-specific pseudouridylate synthase
VGKVGETRVLENFYEKDERANIARIFCEKEKNPNGVEISREKEKHSNGVEFSRGKEKNPNGVEIFREKEKHKQPLKVITEFTILAAEKNYSLLSVSPITGRSHQIRAHLAFVGHPLAGDKKYGGDTSLAKHQLLHCRRLEISDDFAITAPLPKKFSEILRKLGLSM